jgi:hypothetical protein
VHGLVALARRRVDRELDALEAGRDQLLELLGREQRAVGSDVGVGDADVGRGAHELVEVGRHQRLAGRVEPDLLEPEPPGLDDESLEQVQREPPGGPLHARVGAEHARVVAGVGQLDEAVLGEGRIEREIGLALGKALLEDLPGGLVTHHEGKLYQFCVQGMNRPDERVHLRRGILGVPLGGDEAGVGALPAQQLLVGALLGHSARLEHDDVARVADRREPVGDLDHGAALRALNGYRRVRSTKDPLPDNTRPCSLSSTARISDVARRDYANSNVDTSRQIALKRQARQQEETRISTRDQKVAENRGRRGAAALFPDHSATGGRLLRMRRRAGDGFRAVVAALGVADFRFIEDVRASASPLRRSAPKGCRRGQRMSETCRRVRMSEKRILC